jgi:hypothetical protein
MNTRAIIVVAGAALLVGESAHALHWNGLNAPASLQRPVYDDRFYIPDSPHSHSEALEMYIDPTTSIVFSGGLSGPVEGSLDVWLENGSDQYRLIFPPYGEIFARGARPHYTIIGTDMLQSHFTELGSDSDVTKSWIEQVREKGSVSIPNVMLPERYFSTYLTSTEMFRAVARYPGSANLSLEGVSRVGLPRRP